MLSYAKILLVAVFVAAFAAAAVVAPASVLIGMAQSDGTPDLSQPVDVATLSGVSPWRMPTDAVPVPEQVAVTPNQPPAPKPVDLIPTATPVPVSPNPLDSQPKAEPARAFTWNDNVKVQNAVIRPPAPTSRVYQNRSTQYRWPQGYIRSTGYTGSCSGGTCSVSQGVRYTYYRPASYVSYQPRRVGFLARLFGWR